MERAQRRYRAVVIGHTGRGNYGHGLDVALLGLDRVEIVAVADPDEVGRSKARAPPVRAGLDRLTDPAASNSERRPGERNRIELTVMMPATSYGLSDVLATSGVPFVPADDQSQNHLENLG